MNLFVPVGTAPLPEDAEPFDIPGVRLSHRRNHSTFHTMLTEFNLHDPVLERLARIVDEADTVQEVVFESVAPGLDYICDGIRLISPDDETALERGRLVYEALYKQLSLE
ncbi:chromate resistance protein ChrB domain-containing protein [Paenibacillus thermotolerans]|uniref:chromate resistance protein ChrB domain-containing protein n=1 Tax=Paenibacillus thermotolerans TaxID=3027807 RepID=UPI0023676D6C|nr:MULTISPECIES: chromate resistance protein ChrB domain-containing protein [unclassified Paenibacillus]